MSFWSCAVNAFRPRRLGRDVDEELRSHFEEALASGRDPAEIKQSFGSLVRHGELSRDTKVVALLDADHKRGPLPELSASLLTDSCLDQCARRASVVPEPVWALVNPESRRPFPTEPRTSSTTITKLEKKLNCVE
jgi:hypothetical protein